MSGSIAIIDYQMGNLRSVQKAIEAVGGSATITDDPQAIGRADKVILPGVGAFGDAMDELNARGLVPVIRESIDSGKPFLGICLGLQLLFERGEEGGLHEGIGALKGSVRKFTIAESLKVPHMGWNSVRSHDSGDPMMAGIPDEPYFYFVHSYYCDPEDSGDVWLSCDYGGPFCAAVHRGNLYATQFHPEKSQRHGLQLLRNFVGL